MFVKQRKLWVDLSERVWYAVEQYDERIEQNIVTCIDNGHPVGMHSSVTTRCSVANI